MGDIYSVTTRAKTFKQPRGGFLPPRNMTIISCDDGNTLSPVENLHPATVGLVVDYLTRFLMGTPREKAFEISLMGATNAKLITGYDALTKAHNCLLDINMNDADAIINASRIVAYDVWYRNPEAALRENLFHDSLPNDETVRNIQIMIDRCLHFWKEFGPVVYDNFTFEGGYSDTVVAGDGDVLTKDTLWDLKVSKNRPTSVHTLQILMYYIMGKRSIHPHFQSVEKIGIFNPRLNEGYVYEVKDIPQETIRAIEQDVLCYGR